MGRKGDGRSDSARAKVRQFKADPKSKPSPIPLENCPWCGTRFEPASFALLPNDDSARRAAHRLHELRVRLHARPAAPDRRRGRADLPAAAGVPDRDGGQVRVAAVGRPVGRAARWRGPVTMRTGFYGAAEPGQGHAPRSAAAAARPRHPGRAAPDLRAARHDGGPLRGGHRGALRARARRPRGPAQDRRLDRHRAPGAGPDPGALRAAADAGVPAARARPARLVLRPDGAVLGGPRPALPRHRLPGPEPEGHDAEGVAGAHGRRRARLPRRGRAQERRRTPPTPT